MVLSCCASQIIQADDPLHSIWGTMGRSNVGAVSNNEPNRNNLGRMVHGWQVSQS